MTPQQQRLNGFLVDVFNDILRLEEADLHRTCKHLSMTEMHMLEAVYHESAQGDASMAQVARALGVTAGTLTIGIKTLEQKGYVTRLRSATDKRRVHVAITPKAQPVLQAHKAFHSALVLNASKALNTEQIEVLCQALDSLHKHFRTI